jgi:hypothetical protein
MQQVHVQKLTDQAEQLAHKTAQNHQQYCQELRAVVDRVNEPVELNAQQQVRQSPTLHASSGPHAFGAVLGTFSTWPQHAGYVQTILSVPQVQPLRL